MEFLLQILEQAKDFSPLGVAALAIVAMIFFIWKNPFKPIEGKLDKISDNHLHDLPRMADGIEKAVDVLQRIELTLARDLTYIKTKVDEKF